MRFDLKKAALVLVMLLIAGVMVYGMLSLPSLTTKSNSRHTQEILNVLRKAAAECYALEGEYPQNVEYLHDKYGVILDYDRYIYYYDTGGINSIMPEIQVVDRVSVVGDNIKTHD